MSYDFSNLKKLKSRIFLTSLLYSVPKLLVNFVAYFGSLVTIFSVKFFSGGKFVFDGSDITHWGLLVVLFLLLGLGIIDTRKEVIKNFKSRIIVSRQQLFDLIAFFRKDAFYSISNLSVDISWLQEDIGE